MRLRLRREEWLDGLNCAEAEESGLLKNTVKAILYPLPHGHGSVSTVVVAGALT
jgi:hypothetical protein